MESLRTNRLFYGLFLGFILGLSGCTDPVNEPTKPPEDLIPRDTMVRIFVDLRLLDAVVNYEQRMGNPKINDLNYYLNESVMEKYSITRERFERSFIYYQTDLELLDGIYAEAITWMTKMKSLIEQEE